MERDLDSGAYAGLAVAIVDITDAGFIQNRGMH
jgi:hypothetical protein